VQVRSLSSDLLNGEAGVNPALSRNGDGVILPKSDYRPAATAMEAPCVLTVGALEAAALVDQNGDQCLLRAYARMLACAWVVLSQQ
jgi:hypothetical protein